MPDEQAPIPKSGLLQAITGIAGNVFEEAKLLFYVTILASVGALFTCHWLKEMGAYGPTLTALWAGFGGLIAKLGWGKND